MVNFKFVRRSPASTGPGVEQQAFSAPANFSPPRNPRSTIPIHKPKRSSSPWDTHARCWSDFHHGIRHGGQVAGILSEVTRTSLCLRFLKMLSRVPYCPRSGSGARWTEGLRDWDCGPYARSPFVPISTSPGQTYSFFCLWSCLARSSGQISISCQSCSMGAFHPSGFLDLHETFID